MSGWKPRSKEGGTSRGSTQSWNGGKMGKAREEHDMNSRQRVMKALNHEEPDMVPIDMGSTENTTITRIAYINLRKHLEMAEDLQPFVVNRMMDAVYPADDLLRHYQVDFSPLR